MPADEPDPPRKFYEFKPREFERVNPPTGAPQPIPPIEVDHLLRQANSAQPGGVVRAAPGQANDVHVILRENLARANATGLNELASKPARKSRRKRDYWFLMLTGNLALAITALTGLGNPFLFVCSIAGIGFFSAALTWVMWHVMADY